jgi:hypothetical protein
MAGLVLAPLVWVLLALAQDGSARTIAGWEERGAYDTSQLVAPAAYLAVAAVLLGLLATLRVSPAGPVIAGLLLATVYGLMFVDPFQVHDSVPNDWSIFGEPAPLWLPLDNGTLGLIGALLLMAVFSVQRWRRWPAAATVAAGPPAPAEHAEAPEQSESSGQSEPSEQSDTAEWARPSTTEVWTPAARVENPEPLPQRAPLARPAERSAGAEGAAPATAPTPVGQAADLSRPATTPVAQPAEPKRLAQPAELAPSAKATPTPPSPDAAPTRAGDAAATGSGEPAGSGGPTTGTGAADPRPAKATGGASGTAEAADVAETTAGGLPIRRRPAPRPRRGAEEAGDAPAKSPWLAPPRVASEREPGTD